MWTFIGRRLAYAVAAVFVMSFVAFFLINLPPGNYVDRLVQALETGGTSVDDAMRASLNRQYGLDLGFRTRYFRWLRGLMRGEFGRSFVFDRPVATVIAERLPFTLLITITSILFSYIVSFIIGVYAGTHQYSVGDYITAVVGFIGMATPNFLLALLLLYFLFDRFGFNALGLVSPEMVGQPLSVARVTDVLSRLVVPIVVIGTAGTASLIRTMRAMVLDEIRKEYVDTARMKGLPEWKVILKYPVRLALNPLLSTIGFVLPTVISGAGIVSIVLSLPTLGPALLEALMSQDMYLAGTIVLLQTVLVIVGTFLSDVLLVIVDPRIRYD